MCFTDVPADRQQAELIDPAVNCTLGVLESAKKAGTVRRVVMLSSMGAFATPELVGPGKAPETEAVVSEASLNEYKKPPYSNTSKWPPSRWPEERARRRRVRKGSG